MLVRDINKILKNKNMQNQNTNLKILKKKTGGAPRDHRKPPKWFIDFKKENDARWAKQDEFNKKTSKYFTDFANQMLEFVKRQEQFNAYVLEQFKKHGWTK